MPLWSVVTCSTSARLVTTRRVAWLGGHPLNMITKVLMCRDSGDICQAKIGAIPCGKAVNPTKPDFGHKHTIVDVDLQVVHCYRGQILARCAGLESTPGDYEHLILMIP